jgi:hypothetical protein
MSSLIPRVAEEHVMGVVLKLRALEKQCDRMFPEDCVIVDGLRKDGFGAFTVAQKLQIIAHLIEAGFEEPTAADEIDFWIRQIPAGARKSLSSSHHSEAVRRFAILAQSDLPLDVPGLLDRFMASPDPEEFIEDLNQKADPFRRGQDVDVNDPEQMLLGYVAMDRPSPSQENFDHSAWSWSLYERSMKGSVHDHWLPPYWTEGFRFTLPVQASAHEKINKGKLGEWISEMTSAADPTKIRQTLIDLVRKPPKALRASIEAWFASYRPQKGNYLETDLIRLLTRKTDDLAALLGEVIPILKSADTRGDGRINHAIAQFLFAIAFHSPRHRQARLAFLEASRNLSHKSVPGTELLAALGAARALLGDPVNEAAAAMGLKVPAAWMKMREALDDEAARASVTTQASVEVEIVPTKCRTDRFFGYVGEDCTKADASWLGKPNFQLARMIVNGRLDGMVYMQRNYFEGTKDWVLTIEPTPRERLKVDHDALLSGIERGFSAAAKKLGNYRYVVLSAAELEQGNRVDMHAAIRRRKYPKMMIKRRSSSFYDSEESYVLFDRDAGS